MLKVGILFGGPSREREISFAGGRTVFDNLNKSIFEPVPIFIDSLRRPILLDWPYLYKGTIRDFFPPAQFQPPSPNHFQLYVESLENVSFEKMAETVGTPIQLQNLPALIDVAFLALHGEYGEDGQIQGLLESLDIPYTGSGILASALGMDKSVQKEWMKKTGFPTPEITLVSRKNWLQNPTLDNFEQVLQQIGKPIVVRPANQGSSIGVSILKEPSQVQLEKAIDKAFFIHRLSRETWLKWTPDQQIAFVQEQTDIRNGVGFPMTLSYEKTSRHIIQPEELLRVLRKQFKKNQQEIVLLGHWKEQTVLLEAFIHGKEFSCIVIRNTNGNPIALPPTEIIKESPFYDYRSKYLPGLARKETPIALPLSQIDSIRKECERLYSLFGFNTYARIDGFITEDETIYLNDPNTTSGMLPSSFFFHQAAEIGLDPSAFLTYIISASLKERKEQALVTTNASHIDLRLKNLLDQERKKKKKKKKIGVILGGYSFERHISVESGRNIFEKLRSSTKYEPIPIFLAGDMHGFSLYQIPIRLLLKDNADDIRDGIMHQSQHPIIEDIKSACAEITHAFAAESVVFEAREIPLKQLNKLVDGVFIALHGRPGEDGTLQKLLAEEGIPFNGSGPDSSSLTIHKFNTLQLLQKKGFPVTKQALVQKSAFKANNNTFLDDVESQFQYPYIAKPVDDGCSSAVKVIRNRAQFEAYCKAMFRDQIPLTNELRETLGLWVNEEFPQKEEILLEEMITAQNAAQFMEVTVGLYTNIVKGEINYSVMEPSEALAGKDILSLEEKFLAGEGQNITPARFSTNPKLYKKIAQKVKQDIKKAAKILQIEGYARVDAFVRIFEDQHVETIIIEVNSLPGMTPATCIFHQAALEGMKPFDFIDHILEYAFYGHEENIS